MSRPSCHRSFFPRFTLFACLLTLALPTPAVWAKPPEGVTSNLNLNLGYRHEDFDWSIAGNGVNILSELSWQDMHIAEFKVGYELTFNQPRVPLMIDADLGIGWAVAGDVQDSDYRGDDRTQEYSRSYSDAEGSTFYDLGLAAGPVFRPLSRLTLVPKAGIVWSAQRLRLRDGEQVLSVAPWQTQPLGPFSGLDSTYDADWYGPCVGLQVAVDLTETLRLGAEAGYAWLEYEAEADWNLRSDFDHPVSFEQEADGTSLRLSARLDWRIAEPVALGVGGAWQRWETDGGTDITYFSDGSSSYTPFNGANRESWSAWLALTFFF